MTKKRRKKRLAKIRRAVDVLYGSMRHGGLKELDYLVRLARKAK